MNAAPAVRKGLLASFLLVAHAASIARAAGPLSAPYPAAESVALFCRWLEASGFEVESIPGEGGEWTVIGRRAQERWTIRVEPDSPLASRIDAERTARGEADPDALTALAAALDAYAREAGGGGEAVVPKAVSDRRAAVVCLDAPGPGGAIRFSGFVVNRAGLVLSTAHDLDGVREVGVLLMSGERRRGRIVRRDPERDLSLIDIGDEIGHYVSLESGRNLLEPRETVFSIGCPGGRPGAVTRGVVEGSMRNSGGQRLWPVAMETRRGGSGGPVFDARGNPVGVVKGRLRGTTTGGFVIPMGTVVDFLRKGAAR